LLRRGVLVVARKGRGGWRAALAIARRAALVSAAAAAAIEIGCCTALSFSAHFTRAHVYDMWLRRLRRPQFYSSPTAIRTLMKFGTDVFKSYKLDRCGPQQ
jgi:acyl-coenzyme A synthetase/AMP-(fatty) acid ligase